MTVNPVNPKLSHTPMRCTRHRTDGEPCQQWAIPGTDACKHHAGVALATHRARGEANLLMQQAAASSERTHPAVVLLDACQLAYDLMQQAAQGQAEGLDPDAAKALWDRLEGSVDRAARIAKAALDADAQDRHVRAVERRVGVAADVVDGVLRAFVEGLGLEWGSDRVQGALVSALGEG